MSLVMKDPYTKVELIVPDGQAERYLEANYTQEGQVAQPDPHPADESEKELEDYTNAELIAYGADLGLKLKGNKAAMVSAIEAHLTEPAEEVEQDEEEQDDANGVSRNW